MGNLKPRRQPAETRERLIGATQALMLRQGYAATTVDQVCAEAGVTKGAFFHHFDGKEAICRAAVEAWGAMGAGLYAQATADATLDPLAQLDRLLDIMIALTTERDGPCLCMVGMMSQELALTHESVRDACAEQLGAWTRMVADILERARASHPAGAGVDPLRVAWQLNSLWQGSMLVAKTCRDPRIIVDNLEEARAWLHGLFGSRTASG